MSATARQRRRVFPWLILTVLCSAVLVKNLERIFGTESGSQNAIQIPDGFVRVPSAAPEYIAPAVALPTPDPRGAPAIPEGFSLLPQPAHGLFRLETSLPLVAPLDIRTGPGRNYLVKLVGAYDDRAVMSFFIEGGRLLSATVPLGSYRLRYASGVAFLDEAELFGPDTSISEAESIFEFTETPEGISGYTVELILQASGNLDTRPIGRQEF